ncbi:MAG: MoxR family ATPase [Alphaproteobacteria bacterium TMED93]|nr:MAG: MoxR family ATPase [Alphaproteobacteria bacterium TMED93]
MNTLSNKEKNEYTEKSLMLFQKKVADVNSEINQLVFGQEAVIQQIIISLLCGGHALIIGLPGLAKTRIVNFLGIILGLETKRIQFTPDLMPGDILGTEILDEGNKTTNYFKFIKGPIFCQLLLADEINRASPRTQSALLQAMQEKKVTVAGKDYLLPKPFHVLATQNPIDQEGTYPLPEAQLDRFLMNIKINYPDLEAEKKILLLSSKEDTVEPKNIISSEDILLFQKIIKEIPVGESVVKYILKLVNETRPETSTIKSVKDNVLWGPSPRASISLLAASKAKAVLEKRYSPSKLDVKNLIMPILSHRINLNISAKADNINLEEILDDVTEKIEE